MSKSTPRKSKSGRYSRKRNEERGRNFARTRAILAKHRALPPNTLYILPNLFTSASLFLALFAIVKASENDFVFACWLILGSAICDVLDGPVARLTRTASSFGLQYDSLADVVAFGVAPAFLMYRHLHAMDESLLPTYAPRLALGACALFAICSAIRLARFNVQAGTVEKRHFSGLPTPGAAGAVVTAYLFVRWMSELPMLEGSELTRILHRTILIMMAGLAILMVSEIPFPKLTNLIRVSRKPFNTFVIIIVLICLLITFQRALPLFFFSAFAIYIIGSLYVALRQKIRSRPLQNEPPTEA